MADPLRYEYRIAVGGGYEFFLRLRDVEERAEFLALAGMAPRIEHRKIAPEVTEWSLLAWEDTSPGRLGYERFPGYGSPIEAGESSD